MRTLPITLLVAVIIATSFASRFTALAGSLPVNQTADSSLMKPRDRAYAEAMVFSSFLRDHGFAVMSVHRSKLEGFFKGLWKAAVFKTDKGIVEAIFFPTQRGAEEVRVNERREGSRHIYTFVGQPEPDPAHDTMNAAYPVYFLMHGSWFIVTTDQRFASALGKAFGSEETTAGVRPSSLQDLVNEAVRTALAKFAVQKLNENQLSITLIDLRDPEHPAAASFRGNERIYPASVVKLFYLVAAHRWLEDKKIEDTPELRRALKDMIVDSSNEATQYIVDVLTHTTGGYELSPTEMKEWQEKRNAVNRYFSSLGYTNINVNQKTFCEDAYGREHVSRGPNGENRNKLTTEATARLLAEIVTRKTATPERSAQMMELLKRDYSGTSKDADDQAHGFTSMALQGVTGARLWSKAGWTSATRHDAAYIELPNGAKFVLVTFTTDHANEREIIPTVARVVIDGIKNVR